MTNLLAKFQSDDRAKLTQVYTDLTNSIRESFKGSLGAYYDFKYELDGMTSVKVQLHIDSGYISVYLTGSIGADHYDTKDFTVSDKYGMKSIPSDKLQAIRDFAYSKVKLRHDWNVTLGEYSHFRFNTTIDALSDNFLSDLVTLMERFGYVPKVSGYRSVL
jgi:hypothetical protein